jgi:hypothetical protein
MILSNVPETFVKKKGPTKRFRGWVYSKKAAVLSICFSLNNFSLDRRIIGCANRSNLKNPERIEYIIPITIIFKNFNISASRQYNP